MIPIRTEQRLSGLPYVTWLVGLACIAAMVRLALLPDERAIAVLEALGVVPARFLAAPLSPAQLVTLVTSSFLHAGWVHLGGNMLYLAVFGPTVEMHLGRARYMLLYLAAGAAGALLHTLAHPTSTLPLVGASGAIAGILGAHIVLEPRGKITTLIPIVVYVEVASLPAAFVIAFWFALQVTSLLAPVAEGGASTVAWYAHIGGFVVGAAIATAAAPNRNHGRRLR